MNIPRSIIIVLVSAAATSETVAAAPDTNSVQLTPQFINQLSDELRRKHPAILAAQARTNAAVAEVAAVRTWEDPMARVGGMGARENMRAEDGDLIYGVEQRLPLFGKPKLARKRAQADLAIEAANLDFQYQTLRRDLAKAAFRAGLAHEVVAIGEQDLGWLATMSQTVESRYRAGQATLVDVLQLENERAKRSTQLQTDRDQLILELAALNRFLNRELRSPWPVLTLPPISDPVLYTPKLVKVALRNEPKLKVLTRQVGQSEASVEVTRRQRWPDINAGFEARNYTGDGSFRQGMMILSMNLPWVNSRKYRNEVERDQAKLQAAEFDRADYELTVREEVHHLAVKIDAARREALLYRDEVVPRSASALESAQFGWEATRNTFRDLLEARRMLLEGRLMHARAVAEQYQMLSELVLCCGLGDLEALQMLSEEPDVDAKE
jgi:outer membrane protein, heavy metal efflux system